MIYFNPQSKDIKNLNEIRIEFPNVSFSDNCDCAEFGYERLLLSPQPIVGELQVAIHDGAELDSKGNYVQKWVVKDMFNDYTTDEGVVVTKLEQETKYLADKAKALVPNSITPRQARLKLLEVGLLDELEAVITANRSWQIEWEYATEVKRDSLLIDTIATQAGLSSEQIDSMFVEANKL